MPRTTDLLQVKLVAHTLLDVQIQETALPGNRQPPLHKLWDLCTSE